MSNTPFYKLIFYVPTKDAQRVKESIFQTGAGTIGNYSHCSWEVEGIGQFKPLKGSNPSIGTIEKIEQVKELRIELMCTQDQLKDAVFALKESHPYEEPAFDIISIQNHLF